jgi:hypothetical protein
MNLDFNQLFHGLILSFIFTAVGCGFFGIAFWLGSKFCPFKEEIVGDQNVALAIIIAAVVLGISHIIHAAIN